MQLCKPHISPGLQDYGEDYSESEDEDEHAESEDEGSESEMEDEGDEDWASNNAKSGESDDEDALKSVEDLKKSVDDLKKLVPCTIEEFAKVIYLITIQLHKKFLLMLLTKIRIVVCISKKFIRFIYRENDIVPLLYLCKTKWASKLETSHGK